MKLTRAQAIRLIADYVGVAGAVKPVAPIREVLHALDPTLMPYVENGPPAPTGVGIDKSLLRG